MEKKSVVFFHRRKRRVLVAALDWGLGHAMRCIPIVNALLEKAVDVHLAAAGDALTVLGRNFPSLAIHEVPAYNIRYSSGFGQVSRLLLQSPRLIRVVMREHDWLGNRAGRLGLDAVISDNRYGLWDRRIPSVMLIHQLSVRPPALAELLTAPVRRLHYRLLRPFHELWIPDLPGDQNLSGELSHGFSLPPGTRYVGLLSRFAPEKEAPPRDDFVLVLLSGPEPHRSILEEKIMQQASATRLPLIVVGGQPGRGRREPRSRPIYHGFLDGNELEHLIRRARLVISRPGYSTLMDLAVTGTRAAFIPTPGQTEQEYLARYHMGQGHCYAENQDFFSLERMTERSAGTCGIPFAGRQDLLTAAVENFIGE